MSDPPPSRVRQLRQRLGLSQAELARRIGMTRQALCRMEGGAWLPNTAVALRLARCLGTTVEAMFGDDPAELGEPLRDPEAPDSERLAVVRIRDRACAFATESGPALQASFQPADVLTTGAGSRALAPHGDAQTTAVLHGCDPAFGILAALVERGDATRRLLFRFAGSRRALDTLACGRSHLAGIHLVADENDEDQVLQKVREELPGGGRMLTFARWEQGLMLGTGNPHGIVQLEDLTRPGLRLLNREPGSGCRVLLDRELERRGLAPDAIAGYEHTAPGHWPTAQAIACGAADVGLGLRAVAEASGLDFLTLAEVRCDLVVPTDLEDHPTVRKALELLQTRRLRDELASLAGYDSRDTGTTIAEWSAA
jgi:putative molybdopterin biosynthesis protein